MLEAVNPTTSMHEFIEPVVVGKIKCAFCSSTSKHLHLTVHCIGAQTSEAKRDVTNHTSGVNQTPNPWGSMKPRLRTNDLHVINDRFMLPM